MLGPSAVANKGRTLIKAEWAADGNHSKIGHEVFAATFVPPNEPAAHFTFMALVAEMNAVGRQRLHVLLAPSL